MQTATSFAHKPPRLSSSLYSPPSLPAPPVSAALSSPPPPPAPPLQKFPVDTLRPHIHRILHSKFSSSASYNADRTWCKEVAEDIKKRMLEAAPKGWKFVVLVEVTENAGQGGKLDLAGHWDREWDVAITENLITDKIIVSVIALALRVQY
ncbi:hypothetical protein BT69DRAFT_1287200 [Atractiella rhizophila]|nr:hypothetical protein BT69DRAFT_1287199 [Atractiella rhizophila]KAH8916916.1 hypothetical protein BT69DRAFT_1287200 [Atractiella rhizophila]